MDVNRHTTNKNNAGKISTIIKGPTEVAIDSEYEYTIRIDGADDAERWSYEVEVSEGGSATPSNGTSSSSKEFQIKLRAPIKEGDFTITVNGSAYYGGNESYSNRTVYKIHAYRPSLVKVNLYNSGEVDAKNVSVSLYIDGKFQYRAKSDIPSGESKSIELKWNPKAFSEGLHKMKIVLDDSNNLTFLDNGKTVLTEEIYIGQIHEDRTGTWLALAILFSAGAFASFMSFRKKRKMLKRRKW